MSLKSSSLRRAPPRIGVWAWAAVAPNASRATTSNEYRFMAPPDRVRVSLSLRLRLRRLERCVLQQLDVDPHRVCVPAHAHALVGAVDPAQIVLSDRGSDEAQHVGSEPGIMAGV